MKKRRIALLVIMSLPLVAADSGKRSRAWSTSNDLILFEILLDLLGKEDWKNAPSQYTRDLLLDIKRLTKSPALKQYENLIAEIDKQSRHEQVKAT